MDQPEVQNPFRPRIPIEVGELEDGYTLWILALAPTPEEHAAIADLINSDDIGDLDNALAEFERRIFPSVVGAQKRRGEEKITINGSWKEDLRQSGLLRSRERGLAIFKAWGFHFLAEVTRNHQS